MSGSFFEFCLLILIQQMSSFANGYIIYVYASHNKAEQFICVIHDLTTADLKRFVIKSHGITITDNCDLRSQLISAIAEVSPLAHDYYVKIKFLQSNPAIVPEYSIHNLHLPIDGVYIINKYDPVIAKELTSMKALTDGAKNAQSVTVKGDSSAFVYVLEAYTTKTYVSADAATFPREIVNAAASPLTWSAIFTLWENKKLPVPLGPYIQMNVDEIYTLSTFNPKTQKQVDITVLNGQVIG